MKRFYIVLSVSFDYDEEISEVVAWTDNPYVAISYFKEYQLIDSDSSMVVYGCNNTIELVQLLKENYGIEMVECLNSHLTTMISKNERCYAIFKEKYIDKFTNEFTNTHANFICDYICRKMLATTTLMRFINPEYNEVITNLLFIVYAYTSVKKRIRCGFPIDLGKTIDLVYFWKLVIYNNPNQLITVDSELPNPAAVVFIDSGCVK